MSAGRVLACALAAVTLSFKVAQAQFLQDRCDPVSEVLVIRTGDTDLFPSAGIAEPVAVTTFQLLCVRPGESSATLLWKESFDCTDTAASAVISWRDAGRIRINCVIPETEASGEEDN